MLVFKSFTISVLGFPSKGRRGGGDMTRLLSKQERVFFFKPENSAIQYIQSKIRMQKVIYKIYF